MELCLESQLTAVAGNQSRSKKFNSFNSDIHIRLHIHSLTVSVPLVIRLLNQACNNVYP